MTAQNKVNAEYNTYYFPGQEIILPGMRVHLVFIVSLTSANGTLARHHRCIQVLQVNPDSYRWI